MAYSFCFILIIILGVFEQILTDKPIILRTNHSPEHRVIANVSYALQCVVRSGSQPIFFEWFKENRLLESSVYKIDSYGTLSLLSIQNLQTDASGSYKCQARNVFGSDFIETKLIVQGLLDIYSFSPTLVILWPKRGAKFLNFNLI
ncbi:Sorting nexin-17 [Sarcoptes scabiei]|nr:Sorting nexin-17 [Sarcoptes scabiei]